MYNRASPYHKRLAARLQKSRERRGNLHANRYTEIDRFMLAYERAYFDYYRQHITISYKMGWYYIANHKYRHSAVANMTALLLAKVQEEQYPQPEEYKDE